MRWLTTLLGRRDTNTPRRRPARRPALPRRAPGLNLELLEDRAVPVIGAFSTPLPVAAGSFYDGVVRVDNTAAGKFGSGSLLETGRHVLTAAHVVDADLDGREDSERMTVTFNLPGGNEQMVSGSVQVHYWWNGSLGNGYDVAILELDQVAPVEAYRYDIYRSSDEVGKQFSVVGYGWSGNGWSGATVAPSAGVKRAGQNHFDAARSGAILEFDFDNGWTSANSMGGFGLGSAEAGIAPGDSGGPGFIGGKIAGVTSYGRGPGVNWGFGTIGGSARVSSVQGWIDYSNLGGEDDIVFDMREQTAGNDGSPDTIVVAGDGDYLTISVGGRVHREKISRVRSLKIIGSNDNDYVELKLESLAPLYGRNPFTISADGGWGTDSFDLDGYRSLDWWLTGTNRGQVYGTGTDVVNFQRFENLYGNESADVFHFANGIGVTGKIEGSSGTDTLDYRNLTTGVNVNLQNRTATLVGGGVNSIENVRGGSGNDVLVGNSLANRLEGFGGHDTVVGGDGADTLDGGNGADRLDGGSGNDLLVSAPDYHRDVLIGGSGSDAFLWTYVSSGTGASDVLVDFLSSEGDRMGVYVI